MIINFRDNLHVHHYNKSHFCPIFPTNTSLGKVAMQDNEFEKTRVSDYVGPEIREVIHFRNNSKFLSFSLF